MRTTTVLSAIFAMTFGLMVVGCSEDAASPDPTPVTFKVTIENVSQANTLPTDRADGTVPLSPGAYAVYQGDNPIFTVGGVADAGLELIAEDGDVAPTVATLEGIERVSDAGDFTGPGGPILSGESSTFTIVGLPGDRLQFASMFVQSNDWFYAFSGNGLDLFNGSTPVSGDVTASLVLYDAGTEEDTAPGTGPDQKPAQGDGVINVGPADDNTAIRAASEDGFVIPGTASVIRVTIVPQS